MLERDCFENLYKILCSKSDFFIGFTFYSLDQHRGLSSEMSIDRKESLLTSIKAQLSKKTFFIIYKYLFLLK